MAALLKSAGLLGAGAYGYHHLTTEDTLRSLIPRMPYWSETIGSRATSDAPHIRALQGEVDRLSGLLTDSMRQRQYTVVHGEHSGMFWVYVMACLGGVGLYCRWRGIGLVDLLFVSQSAMQQFKHSVSQGLSKLWEEMRKQKDDMMKKLTGVSTRQEQMMTSQQEMDDKLKQVGENVDDVKVNTQRISSRVGLLDNRLADVAQGVASVQQGVLLLCHTVAEVTARIGMPQNTRSQQALKGFLGGGGSGLPSTQGSTPSSGQLLHLPGLDSLSFADELSVTTSQATARESSEEVRGRSYSHPPSTFTRSGEGPFPSAKAGWVTAPAQSSPIWSVFGGK